MIKDKLQARAEQLSKEMEDLSSAIQEAQVDEPKLHKLIVQLFGKKNELEATEDFLRQSLAEEEQEVLTADVSTPFSHTEIEEEIEEELEGEMPCDLLNPEEIAEELFEVSAVNHIFKFHH